MATGGSAHQLRYPVLVRVSETCPGLERKLQKYFQSHRLSGGGECDVKNGPTVGTFWVEFSERQANKGVIEKRDHNVEVGAKCVKVFLETNETSAEKNTWEVNQLSSQTQSFPKKLPDEKHPEEEYASSSSDSIIQKIFLHVEAYLSFKLSKEQREKIINLCPNLKIEDVQDGREKIIGDYQDIEKIYRFLSERFLGNDQKEDFPHSASSRETKKIMPNDWDSPLLHSDPKHRTEELEFIKVPSHLYEYFKYLFSETLKRIEKEHQVHIKSTSAYPMGSVCLNFETSNPWDRKAAQEAFTRVFQEKIQDVISQEVHFTNNKLALEVQRTLADMFKDLHMRAEGKVLIVQGHRKDVFKAKHFIEANFFHKQPVKIILSQNMKKNGIEIDTTHLHLLLQEIIEIEKKYDITTEIVNRPQPGKTLLVFTPKDKGLDLSAHAYECFIDVFQMVTAQIKEVVILKPLDQERKCWPEKTFFEDLERQHPLVNLEWIELKLILTGFPKYLAEARKYIKRFFSIEGPAQQRPALSLGGNWNEDAKPTLNKNGDDFKMALHLSKGLPSYGDLEKEKEEEEKEKCAICMEIRQHKEVLPKCNHAFCGPCVRKAMTCPLCQTPYGTMIGNQPDGKMSHSKFHFSLPGYSSCGTIKILYEMSGGIQTEDHPNPGKSYKGIKQEAFLPDNEEGRHVLNLLTRAFKQRLIFTVGQSQTSGIMNVITWNDIHHKTQTHGGPENFGYPDPNYLERVKMELKAKGIE